ncbi:MAG: flagellar hook-length control protein FliK [Rhizomicrobium sp.]
MSTIAANVVTSGQQTAAAGSATIGPSATDDTFGPMLDEVVQGDKPAGADAAAPTDAKDAKADPSTPAADKPSPDGDPTDAATAARHQAPADTSTPVPAKPRPAHEASDDDTAATADPQKTSAKTARASRRQADATDPNPAPTPQPPTTDNSAATTQAATAAAQATPQPAAAAPQDDATDIAAAAMQPVGTVAKPDKPADAAKPQGGNTKAQTRQSAASALADTGKALGRVFTDQKATGATPPAHGATDPSKPPATQGTDPSAAPDATTQPSSADASASAPPQPGTQAVSQAAGPTPAQVAPPQPDSLAAAAAPSQPAPTAANAAVSAQLQVGHPAAPDIATLAFNIASKSDGGTKHFDIRLDPAELGRVDVHLTVDDAGKAQAMLSVEKPQTLELLQKDQPQLERALKDAGLDLSQNGLNFSLKGQQQGAGNGGNAPSPRGRMLAARAIAAVDSAASTVSLGLVSSSDTRLDIRV